MDFKSEHISWGLKRPKEYASSENIRRGFCDTCGSSLSYRHDEHPDYISLTNATLDDPDLIAPTYHIYTDNKIEWFNLQDDCKRYAQAQKSSDQ